MIQAQNAAGGSVIQLPNATILKAAVWWTRIAFLVSDVPMKNALTLMNVPRTVTIVELTMSNAPTMSGAFNASATLAMTVTRLMLDAVTLTNVRLEVTLVVLIQSVPIRLAVTPVIAKLDTRVIQFLGALTSTNALKDSILAKQILVVPTLLATMPVLVIVDTREMEGQLAAPMSMSVQQIPTIVGLMPFVPTLLDPTPALVKAVILAIHH